MEKKKHTITIKTIHPSLNKWAKQWNPYKQGIEKRYIEEEVSYCSLDVPEFENEVSITITYFMPSKRRYDPDNYSPKFYMDALVYNGIIRDDSGKIIKALIIKMDYDKDNPRAEILIEEL